MTENRSEPDQQELNSLIALHGQGQFEPALAQAGALAARFPRSAALANILGALHAGLRRHETAIAHYRRAIELKPELASAHNNLANSLKDLGRFDDAIGGYRRAIEMRPNYVNAYSNLGNALLAAGRGDEAIDAYRRAIAIQPDYADALFNLGNALKQLDRHDEAVTAFEQALRLRPGHAEAHNNLGNLFRDLHRREAAVASFGQALAIKPDYAEAHNNMGLALRDLERGDEAIASFTRALQLRPELADAHTNLGIELQKLGRKGEAIACYERALALHPDDDALRAQKLHQQAHLCDWDAIAAEAQLIPGLGIAGGPVSPFPLLGLEDAPERHRQRAEHYAREMYGKLVAEPIARPAARPRRLRIGYFSADFHNHATMYLMARLFELHDRERFEIHAYSFGADKDDEMRRRLKAAVEAFHDVRHMEDREAANLARSHGLDIAIDLKGYTGDMRTGIFAWRAAPVQIGWLGYPGTTGASFIDYMIADRVVIPDEQRRHYSEKIIYLPHSYQVNDDRRPIADRPITRAEHGLPEGAFVFCCLNNDYKIRPEEFDIWMRLLKRVENSVLWLMKGNQWVDIALREQAAKRGVDPARLVFAEPIPVADHLARHRLADLFLDTFPYNAHTTASDALWTGLPVITRPGEGFPSRVAASLLGAIGLPELVTASAEEYEQLAFDLATQPERIAELRQRLAANRLTEPLYRSEEQVRHIEQAYDRAFQALVDGKPASDFAV
jgi:predicted O-linked N-acetylglucosamine transferase (SPINDLY family)